MKAHLPWGHEGYTMSVTLTRDEVRDIIDELNTVRGNYPALSELYIEIGGELDAVERVERELREQQHGNDS